MYTVLARVPFQPSRIFVRHEKKSRKRRFLLIGAGGAVAFALCALFGKRCMTKTDKTGDTEPAEAPVEMALADNGKPADEPALVH